MKKKANWSWAEEVGMSSSKVFRDDPSFTRVSLVCEKYTQSPEDTSPLSDRGAPSPEADRVLRSEPEKSPEIDKPIIEEPPDQLPPDIDAIRREAYEQGKLDTEQAVQTGLQNVIDAFARACTEVDNLHKNLTEQSRGDMINLVIALSKKIIGMELTTGRDIIVKTLQNAIELAVKHNEYDIWLNPEDLSVVEKMVPELISSVQQLEHITLKADPQITRGGCKLDSSVCTVDATIEAQLETAKEFLEEKGPDYSLPDL